MSTLFKICFGIAAGLEFIFVPWFLKASRNGRCTKSQILKTICATLFVAAGVLASVIAQNRSDYAHYILIGLLLGWCGDFLLHLPPKMPFTLSGGLAFLAGHVFYIYAYCHAIKRYFPDAPFWDKRELIACAIIIVIGVAAIRLLGVQFSPFYIIGVPYVAMLAFMLVKAGSLGIDILLNAVPEIRNVANVSGEQIANVASGNITSGILLTIAKAINTKLAENATQGVVIISEDV